MRSSRRSPRTHNHICPIGLRCCLTPVHFDGQLVGVAKLVAERDTSETSFSAAMNVLDLVVSGVCQDFLVTALSEDVRTLERRVVKFQQVHSNGKPGADGSGPQVATPCAERAELQNGEIVERAVVYLQQHYQEPGLVLGVVAEAVSCNPKYLTSRFTEIVGECMHTYLVGLRVAHASRLLMDNQMSIKEVAYTAGFLKSARLGRTFRRYVGVSPREYRRIFTGS